MSKASTPRRTSQSILNRRHRLSRLFDPDQSRRHPEIRHLKARLMAEWLAHDANRHGEPIEVRVDARGDLHFYAPSDFNLRDARSTAGRFYKRWIELERKHGPERTDGPNIVSGVEFHFRRDENREHRAWRRRFEKTKAGEAEAAQIRADASREASFIREIAVGNKRLFELVKAVPKTELSRLGIDPTNFQRAHIPRPLRTNFPQKLKLPKREGSKPPNATTFRKGGPNPRRRINPDS